MDVRRMRNLVREIRELLESYGAVDSESIMAATKRMISEHKLAVENDAATRKLNDQLRNEIALARRCQQMAQDSANELLKLSREFEADSMRVRRALDMLLKGFPVEQSDRLNRWIEQDKARWAKTGG